MRSVALSILISALAAGVACAQSVGDEMPPVTASEWLNTAGGRSPIGGDLLEDKVLMLEFWGTWCAPCVRAMPKVQALHERYAKRGLVVVAVTYETRAEVTGFLEEHGYTMAVACDTTKACIERYGIRSWPTTCVIGKDGKIAYRGGPSGAEAAVEEALGLESSPGTLLSMYLEANASKSEETRDLMERLLHKCTTPFDLAAWAIAQLDGAAPETPPRGKVDADRELDACRSAWDDAEKRAAALGRLTAGPTTFDLRAWVRERYGEDYPLASKELKQMLAADEYAAVIDALLDRAPSSAVLKAAAKDDGLARYCQKQAPEALENGRKGLMAIGWVLGEKKPRAEDNEAFWSDMSINGIAMSEDKQRIVGLAIGGELILAESMPAFVERQLLRFALMDALSAGKAQMKNVDARAKKERERIVKTLERKYG